MLLIDDHVLYNSRSHIIRDVDDSNPAAVLYRIVLYRLTWGERYDEGRWVPGDELKYIGD